MRLIHYFIDKLNELLDNIFVGETIQIVIVQENNYILFLLKRLRYHYTSVTFARFMGYKVVLKSLK